MNYTEGLFTVAKICVEPSTFMNPFSSLITIRPSGPPSEQI